MSYGSSAEQSRDSEQPRILIVGLGNPILGDDGIGWRVAEAVKKVLLEESSARPSIEVACYSLGGLSLMERLIGYDQAIIIDAVQTIAGVPGKVYDLCLDDLPDLSAGHLTAVHDMSLQTALKLGREIGASLPSEIRVVGIEADKVFEFSEELSPVIEAAIPEGTQLVLIQLDELLGQRSNLVVADNATGI